MILEQKNSHSNRVTKALNNIHSFGRPKAPVKDDITLTERKEYWEKRREEVWGCDPYEKL